MTTVLNNHYLFAYIRITLSTYMISVKTSLIVLFVIHEVSDIMAAHAKQLFTLVSGHSRFSLCYW